MNKTIAACAALLAAAALCTACTRQPDGNPLADTTPSPVETTLAPLDADAAWTVVEETIPLDEITGSYKLLRYPAFDGEDDTTAALNQALRAAAEHAYTTHAANVQAIIDDGETFVYEVTEVEITRCDDALISVRSFAECSTPTGTDAFVYTGNLNPATAAAYQVDELVTDFSGLAKLLRDGKGSQVWGVDNLLDQITWDDLLVQIKPTYGIYPPVCFTDEGILLCFATNALLGDTAGFLLTYADAGSCLAAGTPQ